MTCHCFGVFIAACPIHNTRREKVELPDGYEKATIRHATLEDNMTEPEMSEGEFRKLMADDELLNRIKELEAENAELKKAVARLDPKKENILCTVITAHTPMTMI